MRRRRCRTQGEITKTAPALAIVTHGGTGVDRVLKYNVSGEGRARQRWVVDCSSDPITAGCALAAQPVVGGRHRRRLRSNFSSAAGSACCARQSVECSPQHGQ